MKKIENSFQIFLANLFNVPINTCTGTLSDTEIETLTYQINNSLFHKRARNILFERLKEQKELSASKAFDIIDKIYAKHIDSELASIIVDKMYEYGFGFMSLDNEQIVKMIRKVGYMRFISFFKNDRNSYDTFLGIFHIFTPDEKKHSENVRTYIKYFSDAGFSYIEAIGSEAVIKIIREKVPTEKAIPNGIKDTINWPAYFGEKLFNKIYLMQ